VKIPIKCDIIIVHHSTAQQLSSYIFCSFLLLNTELSFVLYKRQHIFNSFNHYHIHKTKETKVIPCSIYKHKAYKRGKNFIFNSENETVADVKQEGGKMCRMRVLVEQATNTIIRTRKKFPPNLASSVRMDGEEKKFLFSLHTIYTTEKWGKTSSRIDFPIPHGFFFLALGCQVGESTEWAKNIFSFSFSFMHMRHSWSFFFIQPFQPFILFSLLTCHKKSTKASRENAVFLVVVNTSKRKSRWPHKTFFFLLGGMKRKIFYDESERSLILWYYGIFVYSFVRMQQKHQQK